MINLEYKINIYPLDLRIKHVVVCNINVGVYGYNTVRIYSYIRIVGNELNS